MNLHCESWVTKHNEAIGRRSIDVFNVLGIKIIIYCIYIGLIVFI